MSKIRLNKLHQVMVGLTEGYLSAINLADYVMDEETIRNSPVLLPAAAGEGIRFIGDVNGRVVVEKIHRRKGCSNYTRIHNDQAWNIRGGPGKHLRMTLFRKVLREFWEALETNCLKLLPKSKWPRTLLMTGPRLNHRAITGVEDFTKYAEERFRTHHRLEITVCDTVVVINGAYYDTGYGWRRIK